MKTITASLCLLLAACTAPATPESASAPAAPAAAPPVSTPQEAPMAKRAPGDTTPPMTVFRAFGTEPFWNVNVEDATLTFTTPDNQAGTVMHGTRSPPGEAIAIAGNADDGTPFALSVRPGDCNDGMSDNRYVLVASFRFGDVDYTGCGEAAK